MQERLAIRIDADNHNHHLWNNHGTWWIHYTLDLDGLRARRVRRSLKTSSVDEARARRDSVLLGYQPALALATFSPDENAGEQEACHEN